MVPTWWHIVAENCGVLKLHKSAMYHKKQKLLTLAVRHSGKTPCLTD